MEEQPGYRQADSRLRDAYAQINSSGLEENVKTAVKAVIAIRHVVDWREASERQMSYQVDPAIVKYIRASSAPDLPKLVHDVVAKLPFGLVFRPALGEYVLDIYPQGEDTAAWQEAYQRLKKETVPLVLLSKKFYQDTNEEATP